MQKEIQLTDKTLLVVGLPETTKHVGMMCDNLRVEFVRKDGSTWDYNWGKYVDWKLLGIYPELTEVQCATIGLDLESIQFLMEREKCYTVNPLKFDPTGITTGEWQEAQQRTFSKYAILIKSK